MRRRTQLSRKLLVFFFTICFGHGAVGHAQPAKQKEEEKRLEKQLFDYLEQLRQAINVPANMFASNARVARLDSAIAAKKPVDLNLYFQKGYALLEAGRETEAVDLFEQLLEQVKGVPPSRKLVLPALGLAYMRLAERNNCIKQHFGEACIMPIRGTGIHQDKLPAEKAIQAFEQAMQADSSDLDSRWLLNIAYMVTGNYPAQVPPRWLIQGLDAPSKVKVNGFIDIAPDLHLDHKSCAGGMIVDDFNNDGYLDIICSAWGLQEPMRYFKNNGDGSFTDVSNASRINLFKGGLNLCQADYNNDGWMDFFILRGGWQGQMIGGEQPNSLIRNNGDGTFTDVTIQAGIFSKHPTQTATWSDFNNDGWVDLFIGNETTSPKNQHPCELFINNRNGTFSERAVAAGVNIVGFCKGVSSGDYDNDGWPDLFISTLGGPKYLLHNETGKNKTISFRNVSDISGFSRAVYKTFPTWFFDYNNDGWLDLFICNYEFDKTLSWYAAKEALQPSADPAGKVMIFRNDKGNFVNVSAGMDINQVAFSMGSNFGDIDNDGYLDFYLGTGNPAYQSLIPNKMYKNTGGTNFVDITNDARVGHLQKGHGVAFADLNNDGTQDMVVEMGGAYPGDAYHNAFFFNPGQGNNNWIGLKLEGVRSNKPGIGAKITAIISEDGKERMVYRELNSGGSFGCSPLRQHIGIGNATVIRELKIVWPASGTVQVFKNVIPNRVFKIREDKNDFELVPLKSFQYKKATEAGQDHHH